jgi:hypothetical protein
MEQLMLKRDVTAAVEKTSKSIMAQLLEADYQIVHRICLGKAMSKKYFKTIKSRFDNLGTIISTTDLVSWCASNLDKFSPEYQDIILRVNKKKYVQFPPELYFQLNAEMLRINGAVVEPQVAQVAEEVENFKDKTFVFAYLERGIKKSAQRLKSLKVNAASKEIALYQCLQGYNCEYWTLIEV